MVEKITVTCKKKQQIIHKDSRSCEIILSINYHRVLHVVFKTLFKVRKEVRERMLIFRAFQTHKNYCLQLSFPFIREATLIHNSTSLSSCDVNGKYCCTVKYHGIQRWPMRTREQTGE